ncbi:MAG: SUMF1/EgtB/PvdO family nonheme iron enzyme [Bacteroidota bacterium]
MPLTKVYFLICLFTVNILAAQSKSAGDPEMVFVEGGIFQQGCTVEQNPNCISDEKPAVRVEIFDFWMGKYEVTNAQYAEFLTAVGNQTEGKAPWYAIDKYALITEMASGHYLPIVGYEQYPVTNVSWYGARAYTNWLSQRTNKRYRLPTEAEWEYAAKGGRKSHGFRYSGGDSLSTVAWSFEYAAGSNTGWGFRGDSGIRPVGRKKANELGIHDMSGNVKEWCLDIYTNRYTGGANPKGPKQGSLRVLRGGSWDNRGKDNRVTARNMANHVSNFSVNKGFRLVMEKDIAATLDSFALAKHFHGNILIKSQDEVLYTKSFGLADRENAIPITGNTPFPVASITKLFTSVLILQLAEGELLDPQQTIAHYLPNYGGSGGKVVTLHHLLTHTSGIENSEEVEKDSLGIPKVYQELLSTDELLTKYCSGPLVSPPGSIFNYNNGEYIILGKIIEKVTGMTFGEVLKSRILRPLGMTNSGLLTNDHIPNNMAQGYTLDKDKERFRRDSKKQLQNYFAAGALYATASDLVKFTDALYSGKLLNPTSLNLLLTTYPETNSYGYGLWLRYPRYNTTVARVSQRFGRIWGINTLISHFIDYDLTVIVLGNTNSVSPSDFQDIVGKQLMN